MKKKKTIFVGVSGGVDSSVAAGLLKEQGYAVVGVFIRTWQPEWMECTWRDERRDAMRVCAHLGIPFLECDMTEEYKKGVADYMISEYQAGRTPNPDVMCNKEVKFGGFLKWALERGADYVATGHYARRFSMRKMRELQAPTPSVEQCYFTPSVQMDPVSDGWVLGRGIDNGKDQSYFLWTLTQDQLKHVLFPIGSYPKSKTRKLAQRFALPTATKKDSQGICFLGKISMKEFLSHYIDEQPGDVINAKGEVIGCHHGSLFFTLGERHGFTITKKGTHDDAMYVMSKDIEKNTITVGPKQNTQANEPEKEITLEHINDATNIFAEGFVCEGQIRYHGVIHKVVFTSYDRESARATVTLEPHDTTITPGQSLVLYQGDVCLGGGVVV